MFILYFESAWHEYYHGKYYQGWPQFENWRTGECAWMVPGTDPDDPLYVEEY